MEANILENSCYRLLCALFLMLTTLGAQAQLLAEADCPDAYTLCDASQSYYFEVNGPGAIDDANGSLTLFCQANTTATTFESSSAWFAFTPKYTGEFGFYILPEIEEDWEYILFGNNPDCTDLHNTNYLIICNTESPGNSTDAYTGIGEHPIQGGGYHRWFLAVYYCECWGTVCFIYYSYFIRRRF